MDFNTLAQQHAWTCTDQQSIVLPNTGWTGGQADCAWQNRLRVRRWSGPGGVQAGACVSAQAHGWAWARASVIASVAMPAAWRTAWTSQSLVDNSGLEKRIVILRLLADGAWNITEWRWNPSMRPATRRWQQGRWDVLAARANQYRQTLEVSNAAPATRLLLGVLDANLGARPGESGGQTWQWQTDGLCLKLDALGLGQQLMQLPYSLDDSRLEQRAAMQLQLARRFPNAIWLTDFSVLPAAAHAHGGAKFYAVWREQALLKGQLWIPTKGNGPLVRLRLTTALPLASGGQAEPQAVAHAARVVQGELAGLASRWTAQHE